VKKYLLAITIILGSIFLWNYVSTPVKQALKKSNNSQVVQGSVPSVVPQMNKKRYLFVPYWSYGKTIDSQGFDALIYFGVGVDSYGLETNDDGFNNIPSFVKYAGSKEKILTVRMVDKDINADVIKSKTLQKKIASEAASLAVKDNFDGVLLDYETSAFGFDSTTNAITSFYRLFSQQVHDDNLQFYVTLYGDTYFRARPYDIKRIGGFADKVFIMAYDFSKSNGNPGPNFPLSGKDIYGYDFPTMISDFQKDVPNEKLVITLGYFGYDWEINNKGESISTGIPFSTNRIEQDLVNTCHYENCSLKRTQDTQEPSITYEDDSQKHFVWFEDETSINKKKEFLKSHGIQEIGIWAYSYY
jgi:spore germination protein YaaH